MNRRQAFPFLLLLCTFVPIQSTGHARDGSQPTEEAGTIVKGETDIPLGIGGAGGAYFLASPGELVVELEKRDRHIRGRHTELRAILVGPDRQVLQEVSIPFDGGPRGSGTGAPQTARLSAQVERKGVYGLNITISQDRYGDDIIWGFRTNCPHYLIETSRGHRDERRQEPIVLLNAGEPGDVCFMPRTGAFGMEITGLSDGVGALPVYDTEGELIATLEADAEARASHEFPADAHRDAVPWRLHVPKQPATVQIDGVTRWEKDDLFVNLPYWTPDPASWFPFQEYRWLLTPYHRTVYGSPRDRSRIAFRVHNNSDRETAVRLRLEFPDKKRTARLSRNRVKVGPKESAEVTLAYTVPPDGETRVYHLRATPREDPDFSTYSTLTVKAGVAPATQPLEMPITLRPYQHENEQFGYLPGYPVETQPYFGLENRPFVRVGSGVATWSDGEWTTSDLQTAVQSRTPAFDATSFGMLSTKVAFDRDNDLYVLGTAGSQAALLHSTDGGETFAAYLIPNEEGRPRGGFDIEQFSGHNVPDGPPPLLRYTRTAKDTKLRWRSLNDLELILPEKLEGRISFGQPVMVSDKCIGLSAHSGIPACVVSRGSKVHVAWAEATDPEADVPGVPTFVATYDRDTGQLGEPALVAYGPPPNDVHNSPSITMDSQGYLHVLAGTHGRPFPYARSLKPNDAGPGWTEAELVGEGLPETYIGLVCGPDDTLHMACRLWRSGVEPFPLSSHATLAYQRKRPGEPWEAPRVLIVAPFSEYSIFYHRLTIDRIGRLFLSYDYWSTYWFYRTDHFGRRRALLMSPDGGDTWKLVDNSDFERGVRDDSSRPDRATIHPRPEGSQSMSDRPRFVSNRPDGRFVSTAGFVHAHLKNLKPKLAFDPEMAADDFPAWRKAVRRKLRELMCFPEVPDQPPPKQLWSEQREGYELQKWEAYPEPRSVVPFLVLVPDGISESAPAVLCSPGSTSSKESMAGELEPDGSTSEHPHWERNRMAWWYAREGIVAVAVDNPGIGELSDPLRPERHEICVHAIWTGRHYEGLSVFQRLPILHWLKHRPYVDETRVAVSGHSLGAKPTLILAVLDPSTAATVWNDFVSDWRQRAVVENLQRISIHQYVPGLLEWFDYTDLLASLAPRPLCITEGGRTRDIEKIKQAYRLLGAEENLEVVYYPKYATPELRPYDDVDLPEGLTMEEYLEYANVDVPQHSFKPNVAVPWLTQVLSG